MKGKKSIIIYADWKEKFDCLTDEEAGRLIKHFFRYVNDENPTPPDRITEIAFIDIKHSLKRDLEKWENTVKVRSEAGKKSAEKRKQKQQKSTKATNVNFVKQKSTKATDSVNVSVSVNDSVNVNDINNISFSKFWNEYHLITKRPKTDKEPALKYWNKLSNAERERALNKIREYRNSVDDIKYLKKARTYLADKNFNDEFKKPEKRVADIKIYN